MKYLHIVDYWIPFPSSEYGGVINIIAKNDNECHDLLLKWRSSCDDAHDSRIMERVVNADKFALVDEEESRVINAFIT
jgi:hypothetical protein